MLKPTHLLLGVSLTKGASELLSFIRSTEAIEYIGAG
jgi:hypothetical protein